MYWVLLSFISSNLRIFSCPLPKSGNNLLQNLFSWSSFSTLNNYLSIAKMKLVVRSNCKMNWSMMGFRSVEWCCIPSSCPHFFCWSLGFCLWIPEIWYYFHLYLDTTFIQQFSQTLSSTVPNFSGSLSLSSNEDTTPSTYNTIFFKKAYIRLISCLWLYHVLSQIL